MLCICENISECGIITLPLPCRSRTHEPPLSVQPRHLLFVPSTYFEQLYWEKRKKISISLQGSEENLNNDENQEGKRRTV